MALEHAPAKESAEFKTLMPILSREYAALKGWRRWFVDLLASANLVRTWQDCENLEEDLIRARKLLTLVKALTPLGFLRLWLLGVLLPSVTNVVQLPIIKFFRVHPKLTEIDSTTLEGWLRFDVLSQGTQILCSTPGFQASYLNHLELIYIFSGCKNREAAERVVASLPELEQRRIKTTFNVCLVIAGCTIAEIVAFERKYPKLFSVFSEENYGFEENTSALHFLITEYSQDPQFPKRVGFIERNSSLARAFTAMARARLVDEHHFETLVNWMQLSGLVIPKESILSRMSNINILNANNFAAIIRCEDISGITSMFNSATTRRDVLTIEQAQNYFDFLVDKTNLQLVLLLMGEQRWGALTCIDNCILYKDLLLTIDFSGLAKESVTNEFRRLLFAKCREALVNGQQQARAVVQRFVDRLKDSSPPSHFSSPLLSSKNDADVDVEASMELTCH